MRNYSGTTLALIIMLSVTQTDFAFAQDASNQTQNSSQTPAQALPNQQQNGWQTSCVSAGRNAQLDCTTRQSLVVTNTGQLVASLSLKVDGKAKKQIIQYQLPLGISFPDGVSMQIDSGETVKLDLLTCDNAGCYATLSPSKKILDAMLSGSKLNLDFKDVAKKDIKLTMPLSGFSAAFDKIK